MEQSDTDEDLGSIIQSMFCVVYASGCRKPLRDTSPQLSTPQLCGFVKFGGQSIFDGEEWVLDGFILGRNWQWCQLKVFPQGNVDFPIDSRRVVLSLLWCKCCWSSVRLIEGCGPK